jgi:DNA-directed RNA polymerase subunit RPC12/RpoP
MFTWSELKFKSKACVAQLKLRVVVYSMIVALPACMGLTVLQRLGLGSVADNSIRAVGVVLLIVYVIGVVWIFRRTQRDHGLVCPKCSALLGPELRQVNDKGDCTHCGETIVKP